MFYRQLLRRLTLQSLSPFRLQTQTPKRSNSNHTSKSRARVSKILDRVPRPLRKYTDGLRTAPVTHIVSFLVLHEITAVVSLVGLSYYFHVTNWLPAGFSEETIAAYSEKFESYFRRKGRFGLAVENTKTQTTSDTSQGNAWTPDASARLILEVATAYAITKVIIVPRVLLSIWATPWFARVTVGKLSTALSRFRNRQKK